MKARFGWAAVSFFVLAALGAVPPVAAGPVDPAFMAEYQPFEAKLRAHDHAAVAGFFIYPQKDGLFYNLNAKAAAGEMKRSWSKSKWQSPVIHSDTPGKTLVDFSEEDVEFVFERVDGKYKVRTVYINLEGGD
jgi:hypothetical protein